jgi:hypothetical protein
MENNGRERWQHQHSKVYNRPNALKAIPYRGMIIRPSQEMIGKTHAKQIGDNNVYVSPAIFELFQDPSVHDLIVHQVRIEEIL